jgi:hypothetical protein
MAENFLRRRRAIVRSKSKLPVQPEKKWQGGGNEKQIIEVIVKKRPCADGFD